MSELFEQRARDFVAALKTTKSAVMIHELCRREIAAIRRRRPWGKPELLTVRSRIADLRRAVVAAFGQDHPALGFLALRPHESDLVRDKYRAAVVARHRARKPLDVRAHVAAIGRHFDRLEADPDPAWADLTLAIIAATGRRSIEVLQDLRPEGDFVADGGLLTFGGQRKTRADELPPWYVIPTLVAADRVINQRRRLRIRRDLTGRSAREIGDSSSRLLGHYANGNVAAYEYFVDGAGEPIGPKSLRAAYATSCYQYFADPKISPTAYFARILGHGENDLQTALSYDVYYPTAAPVSYQNAIALELRRELRALERLAKSEFGVDDHVRRSIELIRERLEL